MIQSLSMCLESYQADLQNFTGPALCVQPCSEETDQPLVTLKCEGFFIHVDPFDLMAACQNCLNINREQ